MNFLLVGLNTYKIYIGIIIIIWLLSHFMNTYANRYIIRVNFKKFIYDSDNLKINSSAIDTNTSQNTPILVKKVSSPKRNLRDDIIKVAKTIKKTALRAVGVVKKKKPSAIKKVKDTTSSVVSTVKSETPVIVSTAKNTVSSVSNVIATETTSTPSPQIGTPVSSTAK